MIDPDDALTQPRINTLVDRLKRSNPDAKFEKHSFKAVQDQAGDKLRGLIIDAAVGCIPDGMDPQEHYCRFILPMRLEMDMEYIRKQSFFYDLYLIGWTISLILFKAPLLVLGYRPAPVSMQVFAQK